MQIYTTSYKFILDWSSGKHDKGEDENSFKEF